MQGHTGVKNSIGEGGNRCKLAEQVAIDRLNSSFHTWDMILKDQLLGVR
jgi:hypothetical protein